MTLESVAQVLDVLCPMNLILGAEGDIMHAGPTAQKLFVDGKGTSQSFFELFRVKRPRAVEAMTDLLNPKENKLHLELREQPHTAFKGVVVPLSSDPREEAATLIVNLSFGISIIDGVRDFSLTNADFAATDLAIEMLYLVEAKTAAMEASRRLNISLQGAKIAAEEQAYTDTLTGLKNRRALDAILGRFVGASAQFAVMQIDLDFFKAVNDNMGHAAGDHVLQTVARIMVEETRDADTVARVGGDEFTVILPDVRSHETLRKIGCRIIDRLEEPITFQGEECRISASIGTVWLQTGETSSKEELLSDADIALYASKRAGRSCQTFYSPDLRDPANSAIAPNPPTERRK